MISTIIQKSHSEKDSDQCDNNCNYFPNPTLKNTKKSDGDDDTFNFNKDDITTSANLLPQTQWDNVLRILFPSSSETTTITSRGITLFPCHIEQLHHWDCGVTCLQMIFTWLQLSNHHSSSTHTRPHGEIDDSTTTGHDLREWMIETIQTESIWTIDLVYILHKFSHIQQQRQRRLQQKSEQADGMCTARNDVRYSNFTYAMTTSSSLLMNHDDKNERKQNIHPNDSYYVHLPYYTDTLVQDRLRIQQRFYQMTTILQKSDDDHDSIHIDNVSAINFHQISQVPTTITCSFISMDQIIYCIQHENCVAIALVDNNIFSTACAASASIPASPITFPATDTTTHMKQATPKPRSTPHKNHTYIGHYIIIVGISYDVTHMQKASLFIQATHNENHSSSTQLVQSHRNATNQNTSTIQPINHIQSEGCFVIYNPACTSTSFQDATMPSPDYVTIPHFERSWRTCGTDDDIIFIAKQ